MREIRTSGSEGGGAEANRPSLPLCSTLRVWNGPGSSPGQVCATTTATKTHPSVAARPEHLDAELLFHGAAEAVLHLRALVGRRRRPLVVRLRLDTAPDEIRPGRSTER